MIHTPVTYTNMKSIITVGVLCALVFCSPEAARAGDYEKAWEAILRNDKAKARELLQKAIRGNNNRNSAIATLILYESNEGQHEQIIKKYGNPARQFTEPDAYWYALWFNDALLGDYGKKNETHLANIDYIMNGAAFNGSMKAAASYFKSNHYYVSMQREKAMQLYPEIGALENWQFAGPFDNINGSGFNKAYGPVTEVNKGKGFLSYNNTAIDWFTPPVTNRQAWVFVGTLFPATTAVGYMQTFVQSAEAKEAVLRLGGAGAFKVWVNDKELISEPEEKETELDYYSVKCRLNKGYNRILVQIGYTTDIGSPNFIVRLTDEQDRNLPGITSTSEVQAYRPDITAAAPVAIPHFAEAYFKKQLEKKPEDLANALLLAQVYVRNRENDKARTLLAPIIQRYPQNAFLLSQYYRVLSSRLHHTEMNERLETLKAMDKENYWMLNLEVARLEEEKKYREALEVLNKMDTQAGPTLATMLQRINNMGRLEKLDSMLILLKDAYARFPENDPFVGMMHYVESTLNRSPAKGIAVLEKFCGGKLNFELLKRLAGEYLQQGQQQKGEQVYHTVLEYLGYESSPYEELANYFFGRQQYDSAIHYLGRLHAITPYYHKALGDIGYNYLQQNNKAKALEYFGKGLALHSGMSAYRKQVRMLEGKKDIFSYFPATDNYARITAALKAPHDTAHAFYYIFDEKNVVLHADGANEREVMTAVYLRNNSGIESWKELSLPYNSTYESMNIIKAEVIKANGNKVPGEIYNNEVVFTRLEPGDAIFYHYKMSGYGLGRLGREFWDKFYFSARVPTIQARYSILAGENIPLQYAVAGNSSLKPVISRQENFKLYTWEMKDVPAYKPEPYMPSLDDFGDVLHLSTVKSWNVISEWYSDITRMQSREDYDVNMAYAEIFPKGAAGLSDMEKARRIYQYIEKNIGYSSVSFRQGAYVPQRAAKTLNTKLGDCKDMSALFLAFAHKAGLEANLVLVSTRDNGVKGIRLPSMEFNHCIVQFKAAGKSRYLELTDRYLPFGALPQSVQYAQMLHIPYQYAGGGEQLQQVAPPPNNGGASLTRRVNIRVNQADVEVKTNVVVTGLLTSIIRNKYGNATKDESTDAVKEEIGSFYKNHVELGPYSFSALGEVTDSVGQEVSYTVKNEVVNVGDFSMLRPSFHEPVATQNIFTADARKYPFKYWAYENAEKYVTEVVIELPEGKAFNQVPSGLTTSFDKMNYSLTYEQLAAGKLKITRRFTTDTNKEVPAETFPGMKEFFNKIIESEQKYISFK
ncbi:hypothetical protein DLD77_09510 [Chitinophaga alhagiae]|uniref:Peptide-N(4)-(N-acetyl-beta-glucosaminyl)asparagine amidase n=2 Tax=Chitinophaga alhagiae TaxID=2203219 RepID=A0ABM6WD02_9BACT|nr:hypothetical protein DLD77_09510 [Chitinophaga alhagiae]